MAITLIAIIAIVAMSAVIATKLIAILLIACYVYKTLPACLLCLWQQ